MAQYLDLIDTSTRGKRYDVTPLFKNYEAFHSLLEDLEKLFSGLTFDLVAGIEALGFILGAAIAVRCKKGFVPIRKEGKLPVSVDLAAYMSRSAPSKALEVRYDAFSSGIRVLIVDEWIESGVQVMAATTLIEKQGGSVAGIATIHLDLNEQTQYLMKKYPCYALHSSNTSFY